MNSVEIGDVAQVFNGKTPSKLEQRDAGHPVLKIKDVTDDGQFRGRFDSFIEEGLAQKLVGKFALPGDTLILNAAHNADYVGSKKFLANSEVAGALVTGEWLVVRPDINKLDAKFAHYWLLGTEAYAAVRDLVKGIHLYPKDVARIRLPLPPLDEQRRIAAILDKSDALRRKRKRALELLDSLTQSIFSAMFVVGADPRWAITQVGSITKDMRTGPFGSQLLHSEFTDQGVCVLGIDNAVANEFRWNERRYISLQKYEKLKRYTVKPRDIIITIMGTCGRCAVVPDQMPISINTKHLCCLTLDEQICLPNFLHAAFLQHPSLLRQLGIQAKGAVMPGLNMGIIKSLKIALPPIALQKEFDEIIFALNDSREILQRSLLRANTLFSSIQARAFSGQL